MHERTGTGGTAAFDAVSKFSGLQAASLTDATSFRLGMRQMAAAVSLITTQHEGVRHGMTASAVCSVSADPPRLLVCINRSARTHELVSASGRFAVNVLGAGQAELAKRFSEATVPGTERFQGGEWCTLVTGSPALRDCLVVFDCCVAASVAVGTHTIFVGSVLDVRAQDGDSLLYAQRQFGVFQAA